MAKLNTNGNVYTIVYASILVIIVAFLLAFVASALKRTQDANVANDKRSQILAAALNIKKDSIDNVEKKFDEIITADRIYGEGAIVKSEKDGFNVKNKDFSTDNRPLYIAKVDDQTKYVIPMTGAGLWGGIWGFIALDDDCETVCGAYFSHESETAGLGALIKERAFQKKFKGKKVHSNEDGKNVALSVVKKGSNEEKSLDSSNYVNGITGATLTSNGVNEMIHKSLSEYQDILESLKK